MIRTGFRVGWDKVFLLGALLFCVTLPYPIPFNNIALVVLVTGWLLKDGFVVKWRLLASQRTLYPLFGFALYSAISMIYSDNIQTGLKELETKAGLLAFPVLLGSCRISGPELRLIFRVFVWSVIGANLVCLVWAMANFLDTGHSSVFFYQALSQDTIGLNAIYLANYNAFSILLLYYSDDPFWSNKLRWLLVGTLLFLTAVLSALTVLVFLLLFSCVESYRQFTKQFSRGKSLFLIVLLVVLAGLLLSTIPYTRNKAGRIARLEYTMGDPDSLWNSVTIRLAMWESSGTVIRSNTLMGVGVGDEMDELMKAYAALDFREGIRCHYNVHNQYLSTWLGLGLIGVIILVLVFALPALKVWRNSNGLLLSFLILMAMSFLTENFLGVQKGVVFFAFFYSLMTTQMSKGEDVVAAGG